ncbi:DUF3991 and TOPRIM domain-containing protein [Paenibacillus alvei]|uniref:DUF3991 and TOPRIM domain-containing protein n=1 Tax=Paenibacillus alvei TaxID=44250 RepID=UPI0013DBDA9C|nr:DUF3991 and TOPRIM domain-containing protein [Paenibacillus alvei]NEZ44400.1 DUF3991 domain-containing protein [Paenibacillus alvei]
MKFTQDEIRKARQTDLFSYLQSQNERAIKEGRIPPYEIVRDGNQYRLKDHGGLLFDRNMWNQRSTQAGGNTLEFLVQIEKKGFKEAVAILNSDNHEIKLSRVDLSQRKEKSAVPFVLPEKNETFRRAIAYLTKTRGLDAELVLHEIKKGHIYEDKQFHNVVFVGRDINDEPVWAQKRSTLSERKLVMDQSGSDSRYSYGYGNPSARTVVVVESPIEALSLVSLLKMQNKDISNVYFLSLGGVHDTALKQFLHDHPTCKGILTALNNDRAQKEHEIKGHEGSERIRITYKAKGYTVGSIFPKSNDWNDDLRAVRSKMNEQSKEISKEKSIEDQIRDYARHKKTQRIEERGPVRVRSR